MKSIALVCGEFHRKSVEMMVEYARKRRILWESKSQMLCGCQGPMKSHLPVPDYYLKRISSEWHALV